MGFADDKTAWIEKIGDPYTIIRPSGNIATSGRFAKGRQLLSPFDINFVRFANFPVSSGIVNGDLVQNDTLNYQAFVTGVEDHPQFATNTAVYTELYIINYPSVTVERQSTTYDSNLNETGSGWAAVGTYPMVVEHVGGSTAFKDGLLLPTTVFRVQMQTGSAIQLNDRVTIDSKAYKVDDINLSISPGLQVLQLSVDTR